MTDKESPKHIVPLVLPTQLESKDSDSEDDKMEDGETLKNEDTKTVVYDEDIDGHKSAAFLEIFKATCRDDHLNEEASKKVCHCIMRIEYCFIFK
jgi:hypothetical protein